MASLQPIDIVETLHGGRTRFVPVTFSSGPLTITQLLAAGPILCVPSAPFAAPVTLEIPKFVKVARFYRINYRFVSADGFANTILGNVNFVDNAIKAVEFNGNAGSLPIQYDGRDAYDNFSFPAAFKYIQLDTLSKIVFNNAAVSLTHKMESLATTTAFAPDIVGATNAIYFAIETEVYAVY